MSDNMNTFVNDGPFGLLDNIKISNSAQEQEVKDCSEFLKIECSKYVYYKIIFEALEECINKNSNLDENLKIKVKNIILSESVSQSLTLDDDSYNKTSLLFGVCNFNSLELNYSERNILQEILKLKLAKKKENITTFFKMVDRDVKLLESLHDKIPLQMSFEDKILIEYKKKLVLEQEEYISNLLCLFELLEKIAVLKINDLPQVTSQKIKECLVEEKINHLKSLLLQKKVRVDAFMETNNSLKAYKELIQDIKSQQKDLQNEISNLKDLKEKYIVVSCKQYNDILKSYLQYKSAIEKKKTLFDCLKS